MDAHLRTTPPPKRAVIDASELLLDTDDDALVPFTAVAEPRAVSVEPTDTMPVGDALPSQMRAARTALARFAASSKPVFGWRYALFVVSGICVRPSRSERVLRESITQLLTSVEPSNLDADKEASS